MFRLVLGLIKGAVIGAGVGYGAYHLGLDGGFHWLTYGVVGALVGLLVGRPIWSHLGDKASTIWVPILKAAFGYGIGVGLYALVAKAWGGFDVVLMEQTRNVVDWPFLLGGAIGGLYGAWVEVDDAPAPAAKEAPAAGKGVKAKAKG